MARGMRLPVTTNKKGGADLVQGSEYLAQIVASGLTPNTSRNPFQTGSGVEVGIPEDVVFSISDARTMNRARSAIKRFFDRLHRDELARLIPGAEGITFTRSEGVGDLNATVSYVDLEADDEASVQTNLRDALRGRVNG